MFIKAKKKKSICKAQILSFGFFLSLYNIEIRIIVFLILHKFTMKYFLIKEGCF